MNRFRLPEQKEALLFGINFLDTMLVTLCAIYLGRYIVFTA